MWHSSFWAKMEIQRVGEQSRWAGRGKDIIIPTPPQKSKSDIFTFEFWVFSSIFLTLKAFNIYIQETSFLSVVKFINIFSKFVFCVWLWLRSFWQANVKNLKKKLWSEMYLSFLLCLDIVSQWENLSILENYNRKFSFCFGFQVLHLALLFGVYSRTRGD